MKTTVGVRFSDEQLVTIDYLTRELGINPSELMRQLLPTQQQAEAIIGCIRATPIRCPGQVIREVIGDAIDHVLGGVVG